ncbi:MAG: DUF1294 domain-containing protein [Psychromonas sp.]
MLRITVIIITLVIFIQLNINHQLPILFTYFYFFINLCTFLVYGYDKSAACRKHWRIKELHLHLLALCGGWWGALMAQQLLRHKSIKKSFLVCFIVMIVAHLTLIAILFSALNDNARYY